LNEYFLTPANKGIPDETPLANGNYLIFSPVPFTLQAVLTLRKRKNEALPVVEVTPLIIQLWFRDLLSALCHCHANHVVLRTLHPNQIYIDNSGTAKIGSLYRCHVLHPEERSRCVDGTKNNKAKKGDKEAIDAGDIRSNSYLAPELLFGSSRYTQQSDIWALGCMMAHVILDKVLFHGKDRGSVLHAMFKIIGTPSTDHSKTFANYPHFKSTVESSKMKKYKKNVAKAFRSMMTERSLDTKDYEGLFRLLELMLDLDPDKRISASAALEHESMQNLSSSRTVRNRFVHDWTSFKNQYDLCLKHITSSGANDLDGFYSDDEDNRIDGYKTNSISKEKKVPMALEPLEYFDIDEIMNKSLTPSVPKRVRYSSDGAH
jgi:serine/threonine protein kinase